MEGVSITEWIDVFLGGFAVLGGIVYALVRNHVVLQELQKKVETLFNLFNQMKDKDK